MFQVFKGPLYKRTKGEGEEEFDEDAKRRGLGAGG